MALTILRNDQGELAVVANMTGFLRIGQLGYDCRAARFLDAVPVSVLPMAARNNGIGAAVRAAVAATGAIYPADVMLAAVTAGGEELGRAQGVSGMAGLLGLTRAAVFHRLITITCEKCSVYADRKAYIVHAA